jgi:hypothetical protein
VDSGIATGYAGGGVFNGNAHREVITIPFPYNCEKIKYHLESRVYEALKHRKRHPRVEKRVLLCGKQHVE